MIYDLIIVGAGVAGMSAALQAAKMGAKVALVEREEYVGGVAQTAFHVTLCGFFANDFADPFTILNSGLSNQIVDDLVDTGDARKEQIGKTEVLLTKPNALMTLFEAYLQKEDIDCFMGSELESIIVRNNEIECLELDRNGESLSLKAKAYIDASGCAQIAELSGAELLDIHDRQLGALCAQVSGVDSENALLSVSTAFHIRSIVEELKLFPEMIYSVVHRGSDIKRSVLKISVEANRNYNSVLDASKTLVAELKLRYNAWADAEILDWSSKISQRDDKRILGKSVLMHDDVKMAKKEGGVVKGAWPIEFWDLERGPRYEYLEPGDYYIIPDNCLRSKSYRNLYAAGKTISADSFTLASARVVGTAIATGERAAFIAMNE